MWDYPMGYGEWAELLHCRPLNPPYSIEWREGRSKLRASSSEEGGRENVGDAEGKPAKELERP